MTRQAFELGFMWRPRTIDDISEQPLWMLSAVNSLLVAFPDDGCCTLCGTALTKNTVAMVAILKSAFDMNADGLAALVCGPCAQAPDVEDRVSHSVCKRLHLESVTPGTA